MHSLQQAMEKKVDLETKKPEELKISPTKNTNKLLEEQQNLRKVGLKDKELAEALKIAQEAERAEEEEMMRRAIEESQKIEQQEK